MKKFFQYLIHLTAVCACMARVHPADHFNARNDAKKIMEALRNEDENTITNIFTHRSGNQCVAIAQAFKATYRKDLNNEIEMTLSDGIGKLMMAMATPVAEYYVRALNEDLGSWIPNGKFAVDVLTTSSNAFMKAVEKQFDILTQKKLSSLANNLPARFEALSRNMISGILEGKRNENQEIDEEAARADAQFIYQIGEKQAGKPRKTKDMNSLEDILITRSFSQLRQIGIEYETLYGHGMEKAFEDRAFETAFRRGALNIINVSKSVPDYLVKRLFDALDGAGTNERTLNLIVLGRSENDLDAIRDAYQKLKLKRSR